MESSFLIRLILIGLIMKKASNSLNYYSKKRLRTQQSMRFEIDYNSPNAEQPCDFTTINKWIKPTVRWFMKECKKVDECKRHPVRKEDENATREALIIEIEKAAFPLISASHDLKVNDRKPTNTDTKYRSRSRIIWGRIFHPSRRHSVRHNLDTRQGSSLICTCHKPRLNL
jgi:hypothetical protein